jgi:hypothetical protein
MPRAFVIIALLVATACGGNDEPEGDTTNVYTSPGPNPPGPGGDDHGGASEDGASTSRPDGSSSGDPPDGPSSPPIEPCESLDPSRAYVMGTLKSGSEGSAAIADPDMPTRTCTGFGSRPRYARIRPTDGQLFYSDLDALYRYVPETLVWEQSEELPEGGRWAYPEDPAANDEIVALPCDGAFMRAEFRPSTGEMVATCNGVTWFDERGAVIHEGQLLAVGDDALLAGQKQQPDPRVVIGAVETMLVGPTGTESWDAGVARAADGGFWLVMFTTGDAQRWLVQGTEVVQAEPYLDIGSGDVGIIFFDSALEADGTLVGIEPSDQGWRVQRCVPESCEVVYVFPLDGNIGTTGESWPPIQDLISYAFSGP